MYSGPLERSLPRIARPARPPDMSRRPENPARSSCSRVGQIYGARTKDPPETADSAKCRDRQGQRTGALAGRPSSATPESVPQRRRSAAAAKNASTAPTIAEAVVTRTAANSAPGRSGHSRDSQFDEHRRKLRRFEDDETRPALRIVIESRSRRADSLTSRVRRYGRRAGSRAVSDRTECLRHSDLGSLSLFSPGACPRRSRWPRSGPPRHPTRGPQQCRPVDPLTSGASLRVSA